MTEYTLDVSKWRCGRSGSTKLGEGDTLLLNRQGYLCCLGQFALDAGADPELMLNSACGEPSELAAELDDVYDPNFIKRVKSGQYQNTDLAGELIVINDSILTTPQQKIKKIKKALEKEGHTLKVIGDSEGEEND